MDATKQTLNTSKTTWDLSPLYQSDDDPKMVEDRKQITAVNDDFVKKWRERGDYLKDPKILRQALDELEKIERQWGNSGKEGYYFELRSAQDQVDPKLKAKTSKISDYSRKIYNESQFFPLRIAKIDENLQSEFLESEDLKPYRHFLEQLFNAAKFQLS